MNKSNRPKIADMDTDSWTMDFIECKFSHPALYQELSRVCELAMERFPEIIIEEESIGKLEIAAPTETHYKIVSTWITEQMENAIRCFNNFYRHSLVRKP